MAGGFHISILGGRRTGMLTNLAAPDDVTALFHNPAGLADLSGTRVSLFSSMAFLSQEFHLQALDPVRFPEINPQGCEYAEGGCPWPIGEDGYYSSAIGPESTFGVLPFFGASSDLAFIDPELEGVGVALAAYASNFYGGTLPEDAPTAYFMTKGYFLTASVTAGVGWRIDDWIALGANLSYNYMQMSYGQKLSLIDVLTEEGEEPDIVARLAQMMLGDVLLDYTGVDHGLGWTASALISPLDWLSIGLTYSGATSAAFTGDVTLEALGPEGDRFEQFLTDLGYDLPYGLEVEMPIPPSFQVGINLVPARWIEIGVDFRLWLYTLYDRQIIRPLYREEAEGERPMTEENLSRDKHYDLSYEAALGLLLRPLGCLPGLEWMAGFGYDQSPVPDEHFSIDNPSLNQLVFSTGIRWQIEDHWQVTATYMLLKYLERDVTNSQTSPPTNVRGSGTNHLPALEITASF